MNTDTKTVFGIVGVGVLLIVLAVFCVYETEVTKANAACSEFANWGIENVPVRCYKEFGVSR